MSQQRPKRSVLWVILAVLAALLVLWEILAAAVFPVSVSRQWTGLLVDPAADFQPVDSVRLSFDGAWTPALFQAKKVGYDYEGALTAEIGGVEETAPLYAAKQFSRQNGWQPLLCLSKVVGGSDWVELAGMEVQFGFYTQHGRQIAASLETAGGGRLLLIAGEGALSEAELTAAARELWQ